MRIEHVAVWANDLERLKDFYCTYFEAQAGSKYVNPRRNFESYFLTFASGARMELMRMPAVPAAGPEGATDRLGYTHLAFAVGSSEAVDRLTARLQADGFTVLDGPRVTGDGYYESKVLDPEGNQVELTV
jgi:lactoylglutathione lyase